MADAYTISMSEGKHAEAHSRREYTPMNADVSLKDRNVVIYDCGDDKTHFNDFFAESIEDFNKRQVKNRHPERQKSFDYYDALLTGKEGYGRGKQQEKPIYDDVLQIGNRETNGITYRTFDGDHWKELKQQGKIHEASQYVQKYLNRDPDKEALQQILKEVCEEILHESANSRAYRKAHGLPPGKYDHILIHRLILHFDEPNGTGHADMGYTIFTDEEKEGMKTRVSMTKGMAAMGFRKTKDGFAIEHFRNAIKDRVEEKMAERGFQRDVKNEHRKHMEKDVFILQQKAKEAESQLKTAETKVGEIEAERGIVEAEREMLEYDRDYFEKTKEEWTSDFENHIKKVDDVMETKKKDLKKREAVLQKNEKNLKAKREDFDEEKQAHEQLLLDMLSEVKPEIFDEENYYLGDSETTEDFQEEIYDALHGMLYAKDQEVKNCYSFVLKQLNPKLFDTDGNYTGKSVMPEDFANEFIEEANILIRDFKKEKQNAIAARKAAEKEKLQYEMKEKEIPKRVAKMASEMADQMKKIENEKQGSRRRDYFDFK